MALQAQETFFAPHQEHPVDAAVRSVTGRAAFHFDGRVLEDERTALFHVALRARLPAALAQGGAVGGSVRVVAIGAFHRAFRDAVVRGQGELRLNISMAAETKVGLLLFEKTAVQPAGFLGKFWHRKKAGLRESDRLRPRIPRRLDQVRRVAFVAAHAMQNVSRVREVLLILAALMALQAARRILRGISLEREDQLAGGRGLGVIAVRGFLGVAVGLAGTVAHLAAGHRVRRRRSQTRVMSFSKFQKLGLMARPASLRVRMDIARSGLNGCDRD